MAKMRAGFVALAFLGWCGFAHALALGEINVRSRLNQVLAADIPVSVATPGEADDLAVELASNEEFERAGLERPEFLSALRFGVEGTTIKVSSKQIAREPSITFLLNVRWAKGRLLREYTVLLDPPALAESAGISRKQVVRAEVPAVRPQTPAAAAAPAESPAKGETTPKAPAEAPAQAPAPASTTAPAAAAGGMYGPVAPKETLWSIAYKLRPDPSLTMDQVQIAFLNANPKAFEGGKVSGLMKGSMLRVPTADEIRAVDPVSAKAQVAAARGATPAIAQAEPAPARAKKAKPGKAPKAEVAPSVPPVPPKAETAPTPAPTPAVAPSVPAPKAETAPTAAPQAVTPPPSETTAKKPPPVQPPPTEVAQVPPQAPAATSAAAPSEAPATAPKPAPAPTPARATKPKPAPAPAAQPAPESDLLSTITTQAKDLLDNDMVRYGLAGLIGLLVLIPLGRKVGAVIAKARYERASRKQGEAKMAPMSGGDEEITQVADQPSTQEALEEAAASEAPTIVTATQATPAAAATQAMGEATMQQTMQQTQVQEPALASSGKVDFDVTGSFADQTVQIKLDAGDPVSEAEFHRAYGLYDEAALLLKQALQKDPKRTDARVKLAEIYFEASKANEFVEVAKELKGQLPDAEWQKIALLGTQIAPGNALFGGVAAAGGGAVDISFDEPAAAAVPASPAAPPAAATDAGLEFKLEEVQLDAPATPAAPGPAKPAEGGLEFDLGGLALDTPAAAAPVHAPAASAASADAGFDLGSFDLGTPAAPAGGGTEVVEMSADLGIGDAPAAGDESSTKLDLARAYIDMGDNDMAKSLLNEVSQQGNDQQKKEAQELLKRVAA